MTGWIFLCAMFCTYEAVFLVLFRDRWIRSALKTLRKRFGDDPANDFLNEDAAHRYMEGMAPFWLTAAIGFWAWFGYEINRVL